MSRFRFISIVVGAIALQPYGLWAQQSPGPRVLASFSDESIEAGSVSPNGKFVLLGTKTKLRIYDVGSRQTWDLADGRAEALSWSAKGDRVAWTQGSGASDANVWVMPVDANSGRARGAAQRLTTGRSAMADFSADGKWIGFMSLGDSMKPGLSIVPSTGGPARVVASNFMFEGMLWSADGKSIFVNGPAKTPAGFGVVKIRVDGGTREVLPTPNGELMIGATDDRRYFVLSPFGVGQTVHVGDQATIVDTTGRVVGHVALPPGKVLGFVGVLGDSALIWIAGTDRSVLEIRPVNGGSAKRLPVAGESNDIPFWSPDGKRIAFQVPSAGRTLLAVMNADGTDLHMYRELDVMPNEFGIRWSPDSRMVGVRSADINQLSVLDVAAGKIRTVIEDSIGGWQWRSDGQAIMYRSRRRPGAGIDEGTLNGERRRLVDWPLPNKDLNWTFLGDSSLFLFTVLDTAVYVRPLGAGPTRHLASVPPGWDLRRPVLSTDRRSIGALLARRDANGWITTQLAVFSLSTGAKRTIDLPFSWMTGTIGNNLTFLPGDSAMLIFGRRAGETGVKLFRVPLNGGAPSVFADVGTPLPGKVFAASVSPDGQSVVYSVHSETPTRSLVLIDLRGAIPGTSRTSRR